jgi:hypothetical protein
MPYVRWERCGLTSFSPARWSTVDACSRCHTPLRSDGRSGDRLIGAVSRTRRAAALPRPTSERSHHGASRATT